jgi:hypothetical protein
VAQLPQPTGEQQVETYRALRLRYVRDYADTSPNGKRKLADKLLALADSSPGDPPMQFVALAEAALVAAQVPAAATVNRALDQLEQRFAGNARDLRVRLLKQCAQLAPPQAARVRETLLAAIAAGDAALADADLPQAEAFQEIVGSLQRSSVRLTPDVTAAVNEFSLRLNAARHPVGIVGAPTTAAAPTAATTAAGTAAAPAKQGSVVFVCDASGSMLGVAMDVLKVHLCREIDSLAPGRPFNVIFFRAGGAEPATEHCVPATDAARRRAVELVGRIQVKADSDPIPALRLALRDRPQVVYLVTDGAFENNDAVAREIRRLNGAGATRIHVIALLRRSMAEADRRLAELSLRRFAEENGGWFRVAELP